MNPETKVTNPAPAMTDAQMAAGLINTRHLPVGLTRAQEMAKQARAYHRQKPYPYYHFKDWNTDERGPLPRCLSLAKTAVKRGATWLFGKPIQLNCSGNEALAAYLRAAWAMNRMPSRLRAIGIRAALDSGVALKFAVDETDPRNPFSIQSLSLMEQARLYPHPHDRSRLLMARVQYPYHDAATGKTMLYREEWTAEEEVHYEPLEMARLGNAENIADTTDQWVIASQTENKFGVIPVHLCRNLEADDFWGAADWWSLEEEDGLFRVFDRLNLTFHLMDRSNQFDSTINPIFIDLEPLEEDAGRAKEPGEAVHLESAKADDAGSQGKAVFAPSGNNLRPAMREYAGDLRRDLLEAVSTVLLDPGEVTNKGNLTTAVLEIIYAAQIDITTEKRKSMGEDGLAAFLSLAARGLQNAGVKLGVTDSAESSAVQLGWSDFFAPSDDEKTARTDRTITQESQGYLDHGRAIERIARMEQISDVEQLKKDVPAQAPMPENGDEDEN